MGGAAYAVAWLLAKGGMDIAAKNKEGHTPLDKARLKCKPEAVALLEKAMSTVGGVPACLEPVPNPDDAVGGGGEVAAAVSAVDHADADAPLAAVTAGAALPTTDEAGGGGVVAAAAAAAAPASGNAAPENAREPPPPSSKRPRLMGTSTGWS